jgi:hypothetical protein
MPGSAGSINSSWTEQVLCDADKKLIMDDAIKLFIFSICVIMKYTHFVSGKPANKIFVCDESSFKKTQEKQ